jgi:peptidyl-dipeptidase Dcp
MILLSGAALAALAANVLMAQTGQSGSASQADAAMPDNILLAEWTGPHGGVPPWDRVRPELFPAAFEFAIAEQRQEVQAIANNRAAPTFENTIAALDGAGQRLGRVQTLFGVMNLNMSTPAYQALQREWGPRLAAAQDEILLNGPLFQRIRAVHEARTRAGLTPAQQRLTEQTYDQFVQRGANLNDAQKQQLSAYNQQLARLFAEFSQKLLADESTHIVATEAELAGVPADIRNAAAAAARERNLAAGQFAIVNTRSAVDPILTFAENRGLRERVWRAFTNRGDNGDANDTNATIRQIVQVRAQRARLLGYPHHAAWRMEGTMAENPERAQQLMMRVWPAAVARVREEVAEQQAVARRLGHDITIEPWDYRYYMERIRRERFNLSQEEIKPYFQLSNMIQGMFHMAGQLYGLEFTEITGQVPVFHPDVRTWRVTRRADGSEVGIFYGDMFARTGKRSGAWHQAYRIRTRLLGDRIVLNSNNNNFVNPGPNQPVLISLDDARTLFHEFGHALHYLLVDVGYPGLAGPPRDFVEYPSQVHENWLLTPEILNRFARHYQTGEPMPQALVQRIQAASTFNQGFATVEYLSSALVDMALHVRPDGAIDPDAFERETLTRLGMPRELVMRHRLPQFGHLFQNDNYSAGYYSYLWSETMDADTWAAFEAGGNVWDPNMARRFAEILLRTGDETDRTEAYRAFRGRDPDVNALLRRRGFPTGR